VGQTEELSPQTKAMPLASRRAGVFLWINGALHLKV
jgi:hypothetical protein